MSDKSVEIHDIDLEEEGPLRGMFKKYFIDYASYVILERAVPEVRDGLKPVQRRILYSMFEKDDGRYHKVANLIGHCMQYHPHGDAAIGDALVTLGQKELLIDCQGNWGDIRTGDSAAASRYIEARLTPFAKEVLFNKDTTEWQLTYDGRNQEPVALPSKFPLLLAMGTEGIAVGLSTKVLPHNFIELIHACIDILKGKSVEIFPDFLTGGLIDVSDYRQGRRGGKVKVRAKIEQVDKKHLAIVDIPYGVTTSSLIDSIVKAGEKGLIKIKRIVDNTAKDVEILIELAAGVSPEVTIDALYAFSNCEVSISPNACIIVNGVPQFLGVDDILKIDAERTRELLGWELEIRLQDLENKWFHASLEKIFISKRVYRDIEDCESWQEVLEVVKLGMYKYISCPENPNPQTKLLELKRNITDDDIHKLTEIKIRRISRYNEFKAEELITQLEEDISETKFHLENLTDYAIHYFEGLLKKYGAGRERRTQITGFENIQATQVVAKNAKLYVNYKDGFIGYGLKKDEFVCDCADIDDIIVFRRDGKMLVTRIDEKSFVGKDILLANVWKKGDDRTTYNLLYRDGKTGNTYAKRFHVKSITRDKEYDLTTGEKGSRVLYLSENPNGEAEIMTIYLSPGSRARNKVFDFDFGDMMIKGRGSKGNIATKYPVRKVSLKEVGKSTLGAIKYWMDEVSGRLNTEERGKYLGEFDTGDHLIAIYRDGSYELTAPEETSRFEVDNLIEVRKFNPKTPINVVYFEGEKKWTLVKRFLVETSSLDQKFPFISEHRSSELYFTSFAPNPQIEFTYRKGKEKITEAISIADFIDVKGWKAMGNRLHADKIEGVKLLDEGRPVKEEASEEKKDAGLKPGDSIDFDLPSGKQGSLFDHED
ncbi:MAG: DNA gyrase/topoisomerase IV subunit A [Saprospirales bacterium]|nr:MAG: DNA gyrase/topoisomerase IV subunit A [Saprospirales bacterium]